MENFWRPEEAEEEGELGLEEVGEGPRPQVEVEVAEHFQHPEGGQEYIINGIQQAGNGRNMALTQRPYPGRRRRPRLRLRSVTVGLVRRLSWQRRRKTPGVNIRHLGSSAGLKTEPLVCHATFDGGRRRGGIGVRRSAAVCPRRVDGRLPRGCFIVLVQRRAVLEAQETQHRRIMSSGQYEAVSCFSALGWKVTFAIRIPVTQRFKVQASSQHRYLMY